MKEIKLNKTKLCNIIAETLKKHINENLGDEWKYGNEYEDGQSDDYFFQIAFDPEDMCYMTLHTYRIRIVLNGDTTLREAAAEFYKRLISD